MAGRRKAMSRRLTELEERAFQLSVDVTAARPMIYAKRQGSEGEDETSATWNRAVYAVSVASIAVSIVLDMVAERAGLDWETLQHEREQRRGLLVEKTEDRAIVGVDGAETAETAET